jgi:hypothetical protein
MYIPKRIDLSDDSSDDDEGIVNKYNRIVFFNEENLPIRHCESDATDFSGILPLLTYDKSKRGRLTKRFSDVSDYLQRIDSFTIPRSGSSNVMFFK